MIEEEIIGLVAVVLFFVTVVIVVWVVAQTIRHRSSVRAEQMDKVLDKFETADEFNVFARSEAGGRLLNTITGRDSGGSTQVSADMGSIKRGINATALGLGGTLFGMAVGPDFITGLGVIALAYGLAVLASAYVARRLGAEELDETDQAEDVEEGPDEDIFVTEGGEDEGDKMSSAQGLPVSRE